MQHNFQARSYNNLSGDNDVCTKCDHSRIFVREFGSNECGGNVSIIPKTIYVVLEDLRNKLSALTITLDIRYEALGKFVANTPGYVYVDCYGGNLVFSAEYNSLLAEAQVALKDKQALEAVIETLAKEAE